MNWLRRSRLRADDQPRALAADATSRRTMQSLGRRYVRHVNAVYRRTGTLWEGRYRARRSMARPTFWPACRYIEVNPLQATACQALGGRVAPLARGRPPKADAERRHVPIPPRTSIRVTH